MTSLTFWKLHLGKILCEIMNEKFILRLKYDFSPTPV